MVLLNCASIRDGSTITVVIDENWTVALLKKAIKAEKPNKIKCDADELRLFLAKKGDAWLPDDDAAAQAIYNGVSHPDVQRVIDGEEMQATWPIADLLKGLTPPVPRHIHVLVLLPGKSSRILLHEDLQRDGLFQFTDDVEHENMVEEAHKELELYRRRGQVIKENCPEYCHEVLSKIDDLFTSSVPLPFMCVEGSSGMGKSQLAFALQGRRPWFYWFASQVGVNSQSLYKNFFSVTSWFHRFVVRDLTPDGTMVRSDNDTLLSNSALYLTESLWTFGFIRALLEYCRMEEHYDAQMIHFDEETALNVSVCNSEAVRNVCRDMKQENKFLPFFILDEMTPNSNIQAGGKNIAAFQRNVFRVCGLVVIVMGTDSKISNLVAQSHFSYSEKTHRWMAVDPRFPPYQIVLHKTEDEDSWKKLVFQFPVLKYIAEASRGRFSRYFVEEVLKYVACHRTVCLCALLDETLGEVCLRTHRGKDFMSSKQGRYAQLMAISNSNASDIPLRKKRRMEVGTDSMHLHFANLVDSQITDVFLYKAKLLCDGKEWKPFCCFPGMEEDLLLYLAVLGGKSYSGYYDPLREETYSTKMMFLQYMEGNGFPIDENNEARSNNYKTYENMIAHAFFGASRRNGVGGISFDAFFSWLLGEFRDNLAMVEMTLRDGVIVASNLFEGYQDMSTTTIPFLAPPNARWPQCILDLTECNFGHLVRARNSDRVDVYIPGVVKGEILVLGECKYWSRKVNIRTLNAIIKGLNEEWIWKFVLVFCVASANFRSWEEKKIGCVTIDSQSGQVKWNFQPKVRHREKLIIIVETGAISPT